MITRKLLTILALAILVGPVLAQTTPDSFETDDTDTIRPRKRPSWFRRPEKDTPAEQWEWANELKARDKTSAALRQFRALVHQWHDAPEAPQAQWWHARLLEEKGKHRQAFDEFQYLIDHYAGQIRYEPILDHQFRLAQVEMTKRRATFFGLFPGFMAPERALPLFETIVENGPTWEKSPEAQFRIGLIHEEANELDEAIVAYESVRHHYPNSPFIAEAAFRHAVCLAVLAQKQSRDIEPSYVAIAALGRFVRDYPQSPNRPEAEERLETVRARLAENAYQQALFYDRAKRPRAALIAYTSFVKDFPTSDLARLARQRITILEQMVEEDDER